MSKIYLSTSVSSSSNRSIGQMVTEGLDNYLCLGGRRAAVIDSHDLTVLRILGCFTAFFPVMFFVGKAVMQSSHPYQKLEGSDLSERALSSIESELSSISSRMFSIDEKLDAFGSAEETGTEEWESSSELSTSSEEWESSSELSTSSEEISEYADEIDITQFKNGLQEVAETEKRFFNNLQAKLNVVNREGFLKVFRKKDRSLAKTFLKDLQDFIVNFQSNVTELLTLAGSLNKENLSIEEIGSVAKSYHRFFISEQFEEYFQEAQKLASHEYRFSEMLFKKRRVRQGIRVNILSCQELLREWLSREEIVDYTSPFYLISQRLQQYQMTLKNTEGHANQIGLFHLEHLLNESVEKTDLLVSKFNCQIDVCQINNYLRMSHKTFLRSKTKRKLRNEIEFYVTSKCLYQTIPEVSEDDPLEEEKVTLIQLQRNLVLAYEKRRSRVVREIRDKDLLSDKERKMLEQDSAMSQMAIRWEQLCMYTQTT